MGEKSVEGTTAGRRGDAVPGPRCAGACCAGAEEGALDGAGSGAAGTLTGSGAAGMSRRRVFQAAGTGVAAAVAGGALSSCGGPEESYEDQFAVAEPVTVPIADVEVGSGLVVDQTYVVAQPRAGEFYAYSSVCPHQGCQVRQVTQADINCPCHSSKFRVEDGSVLMGPAESPLPRAEVTVEGETLSISPSSS